MEEIAKTIAEDGSIEVQVAPIGQFEGSDHEGNPVPENITKESLDALAERLNSNEKEILTDVDHQSVKPGLDRDTKAVGWMSKFYTTVKGLFAKLFLTPFGRKLVEDREYRFLSPVFSLDDNGNPVDLHSAAFTNTPAFEGSIEPILNHKAVNQTAESITDMTKEELVDLIKETVSAMKETAETTEEKAETVEDTTEETCDQCGDVEKTETVNEETTTEETTTEETVEEASEEADETSEEGTSEEEDPEPKKIKTGNEDGVVKLSALNSKPTTMLQSVEGGTPPWAGLHGQKFFDELQKHPEWRNWSKEA